MGRIDNLKGYHWIDNEQLALMQEERIVLQTIDDQIDVVKEVSAEYYKRIWQFLLSPTGEHMITRSRDNRTWIQTITTGDVQQVGWGMNGFGGGVGAAWDATGARVIFKNHEGQQSSVRLWTAATGEVEEIIRTGEGFMGKFGEESVGLGNLCWVDEYRVFSMANSSRNVNAPFVFDVRTGELWQLAFAEGHRMPYDESYCNNGHLTIPIQIPEIALYRFFATK